MDGRSRREYLEVGGARIPIRVTEVGEPPLLSTQNEEPETAARVWAILGTTGAAVALLGAFLWATGAIRLGD